MVVLVTGAAGQLGQALQYISPDFKNIDFYFTDSEKADITNKAQLEELFALVKPQFCINAAAYTAVDKAENEPEKAALINVEGAANLAKVCKKYNVSLIHISTDFVFDGEKTRPYTEDDKTNPMGVYGLTKRDGEAKVREILPQHYIIRTSWVYSQFGNNFMKTMLKAAREREFLNVVDDQRGTPTHAIDLARAIVQVITSNKQAYGTYHFSNEGETTWYGFAKKIFEVNNIMVDLRPIPTSGYPTPAKRPKYSVLDKSKIINTFDIQINNWEDSLKRL